MSTAALAHDAFAPQRPPGMGPGLGLALVAHVLLILALAWSVNWKTSEPEGVVAELWSALPQIAAPPVAPPVAVPQPPRPPVVVAAQPTPPRPEPARPEPVAPPRADAQIAIERAAAAKKLEAQKKAEAEKREETRRAVAEREKQRVAEEQAEKKKLAEKARQDQVNEAAARDAYLRRVMKQAGASTDPTAAGNAERTAGPSASYGGRIKAYMRPFIKTPGSLSGAFRVEVEVRLSSDGTILSTRITKPSGSAVWDATILRALESAGSLPRDTDGRVPSPMLLGFTSNE